MNFAKRCAEAAARTNSLLCVGLDPDPRDHPSAAAAERFCLDVLTATLPLACAVKANAAYFEQFGATGLIVLERIRNYVPSDRLLILDAKRGDIGTSAQAYARAAFDVIGADAVTVNPLMGHDAVAPFLGRDGRGAFLLTRTSNPGAADLLDQPLASGEALYLRIADLGVRWDPGGAVGFVVGATAVDAIAAIRSRTPDTPLLIPGVGAQGGSLEGAVAAGLDQEGARLLINVGRGIANAPEGYAGAAAALRDRIETARMAVRAGWRG